MSGPSSRLGSLPPGSGRILVVDDEAHIRRVLRGYLEADGFTVAEAGSTEQARGLLVGTKALLLDIGLPDGNGLDLLRELRRNTATADVAVLLISARSEEIDRLLGLEVGADDYITKPFSPREVVARVRAVLRRSRPSAPPPDARPLRIDGLEVDVAAREARVDERPVQLTPIEFDLLATMAAAPGRVYSRAQLLDAVWPDGHFGDPRVVDVHVRGLRRALGDDPFEPRFVATVRGAGYKAVRPATATRRPSTEQAR